MKKALLFLLAWPLFVKSQDTTSLTLERAYDLSRSNYPVIKQKDLVRQTNQLTLSNLASGFLPQFSLNGQATYQSDVTKVNVPLPGVTIPSPSKDQYKFTADLNQLIYDGGVIKQQKQIQQLNTAVEDQKLEVELYKLKERINQLFLGVLYLDEQLKQVDLVKADLTNGIKRVEAQVNNGVAFKSNLNSLKAELLKADQRAIELQSTRKGYLSTLELFVNRSLPETITLVRPEEAKSAGSVSTINRPELKLFDDQSILFGQQSKLIASKNLPKASLFAQGGYGRPGLNLLDNNFDLFYIGGIRLNWSLGGLYTQKKEKQLVKINQQTAAIQKETFLLNTNTQLKQQESEVEKLERLIVSDREIIELRQGVKDASKAQLENGVITSNDYLREVNAEDQARQALIAHELQLLQAKINYKTISGNQ